MTGCYELQVAVSIPDVTENKDKLGEIPMKVDGAIFSL